MKFSVEITQDKSTASISNRWNLFVNGQFAGTWRGAKEEAASVAVEIAEQFSAMRKS